MESELRPCPFCGNLKPIRATKFVKPIRATKFAYGWKVSCRCGAKVSYKQTEDEAIAVWNARASDWTPITPENLPKDGDEMLGVSSLHGQTWTSVSHVGKHKRMWTCEDFLNAGWTHSRPITPPAQASEPPDRSFGRPAEERTRRTPVDAISTPIVQPVPVPLVERIPEAPHD